MLQLDQFVELVTNHPRGGIQALLEIAGYQEVEWLEFKAAACHGMDPKTDQTKDLQWRIARAVIAMANSRGGCVIVGIADDGSPVSISQSDPGGSIKKFGRDYFLRKSIIEKILQPDNGWKAKQGRMTLDRKLPDLCFEVLLTDYATEKVILILVHPIPIAGNLLRVVNEDLDREFVPIRQAGHIGQIRELSKQSEIRDHADQRRLESSEITAAWNKFNETPPEPDSALEREVVAYLSTVRTNLARLSLDFTNLDGSQRDDLKVDGELLVPEVDEVSRWIDPDNAWSDQLEIAEGHSTSPESLQEGPSGLRRNKSVLELLREVNRAVLIGRPGSGKTTCLQRIALQTAQEYSHGKHVALFVPLAIYRSGGLFPLLRRVSNISIANLDRLAQSRRLLLLLDGLNECPATLLDSCALELKLLLQRFPDLSVVISCRTAPYGAGLGLPTFEVLPLSESQQLQFLESRIGNRDRATEIIGQFRQSPASISVASNPLLLAIAAAVALVNADVPSGLGSLYLAYMSKWFEREKRKALIAQETFPWALDHVLDAFSAVAFRMRIAGKVACDPEFALESVVGIVPDPDRFFERLAQGLLFVLNPSLGTFSFEHETLQELLCAFHMSKCPQSAWEALHKGQNRDSWRMPIAFLFEIGAVPDDLAREIWNWEPLIFAVAAREDSDLAQMDISRCEDSWSRGIIHSLRRELVPETLEIREHLLSAPPTNVKRIIRSDAFWYAGLTHPAGVKRIERFESLIERNPEPWADLMADACSGNPDWVEKWRQKDSGLFLACCGVEELPDIVYMQDGAPPDATAQVLARLVYQRRIAQAIWASSPWVRRSFFRGPWFKIPSLLSARQWRLAIKRGALGSSVHRSIDPWLLSQLAAMEPVVPSLVRLGILRKDQLNPRRRQRCLKYLESREVGVFARDGLIGPGDISDALVAEWIKRSSVAMIAELIRNGLVTAGRILSQAETQWPSGKCFALLDRLIDTATGDDNEIIEACLRLCEPSDILATQLPPVDSAEEAVPEVYIREAEKALLMPIGDSFDLVYFVASVNLLNAVANRLRRSRASAWSSIQLVVQAAKRRLARQLFEAACSSFESTEVYLSAESTYIRAFGVQFGFRSLPVADYARDLNSRALNVTQEWWGRRLQPIACSALDWARTLKEERSDIGNAQILEKLKISDVQLSIRETSELN